MSNLTRWLAIAFFEALMVTCTVRGGFFYLHAKLSFSDAQNLFVVLGFGVVYVVTALTSHRLAVWVSEKRLICLCLLAQIVTQAAMFACPNWIVLVAGIISLGLFGGWKWPVLESFVSAGQAPSMQMRSVGRFSVAWALAVPVGLLITGPVIDFCGSGLFALMAAANGLSLLLIRPSALRPVHLPQDHPHRPSAEMTHRLVALLGCSRWLMFASFAAMWVLAALTPNIFAGLGYGVTWGPALTGLLDVARLGAFVLLQRYPGWHNRPAPLAAMMVVLPVSFFMIVFGGSLAVVLLGELLFGAAMGQTYYAALYYAMVVKNASVDAGGVHEGLVGLGGVLGPMATLGGIALAPLLGSDVWGPVLGMSPVFVICSAAAAWQLGKIRLR